MSGASTGRLDRRGRIAKRGAMLAVLTASALTFLAWSQTWFVLQIRATDTTTTSVLDVGGASASPALAALGLAGLALVAALAIAGPMIRIILGVLAIALGGSIVAASVASLADPAAASTSAVGASTGVAGIDSVRALVVSAVATPWPFLAVVSGVLVILVAGSLLATNSWWPRSGRRYQAVVFESEAGERSADPARLASRADDAAAAAATGRPADAAIEDWDRLSAGQDPTD